MTDEEIIDAITDLGVYPKSVEGSYDERSEWQEGWNAAVTEMHRIYAEKLEVAGC